MKPFKEFTDEELDEFEHLRDRYFCPWDCWNAGCKCVEEDCIGDYDNEDYDEILYCDYDAETVCPMLKMWKMKETNV